MYMMSEEDIQGRVFWTCVFIVLFFVLFLPEKLAAFITWAFRTFWYVLGY